MKFEEEFPSLKDKKCCTIKSNSAIIQNVIREGKTIIVDEIADVIFNDAIEIKDIQKHCLDKTKVKKVIRKAEKIIERQECGQGCDSAMDLIERELGLE